MHCMNAWRLRSVEFVRLLFGSGSGGYLYAGEKQTRLVRVVAWVTRIPTVVR